MNDLLDLDLSAPSSDPQHSTNAAKRGPQAKYSASKSSFDYLSSMGSSSTAYGAQSRSNAPFNGSTSANISAVAPKQAPVALATKHTATSAGSDAFSSLFESGSSSNGASTSSQSMAARMTPTAGVGALSANKSVGSSPLYLGSRPSSAASWVDCASQASLMWGAPADIRSDSSTFTNGIDASASDAWNFDLLANKPSAPPKPSSQVAELIPRMVSSALDDDDDPFDMGTSLLPSSSITSAPAASTGNPPNTDDFDLLGAFSQPATKRSAAEPALFASSATPRTRRTPSPPPHVLGQIVEMGFSIPQAKTALAATATPDGDWNVQAALEALMDQTFAESRAEKRREEEEMGRRAAQRLQDEEDQPRRPRRTYYEDEDDDFGQSREEPVLRRRADRNGRGTPRQDGDSSSSADVQARVQEQANELLSQASKFGLSMFKSGKAYWESGKASLQKALDEANAGGDAPRDKNPRTGEKLQNGRPKWWTEEKADNGEPAWSRDEPRQGIAPRKQEPTRRSPSSFRDSDDENSSPGSVSAARPQSISQPPQRPSAPPVSDLLGSNQTTQGATAAYKSPWRRAKHTESSRAASPASPSLSTPATPKRTPSPAFITRTHVHVPPAQLAAAMSHKDKGNELFKLGRFGEAVTSYSSAISILPGGSLALVLLYNNRAAARLKNGEERAAAEDCTAAMSLVLGDQSLERIDVAALARETMPGDLQNVNLAEQLGKALFKRAKSYEATEKWSSASDDYLTLLKGGEPLLKAAGGIKIVNEGVARCRQMTSQAATGSAKSTRSNGTANAADRPAVAPRPRPSTAGRPAVKTTGEAAQALRAANAAAEAEDDLRLQLKDSVDAKILAWKGGKETNLRALIASLDNVVWPELGWKTVGMNQLLSEGQLKGQYVRAIAKLHPDKLNATNTTVEQRMIAVVLELCRFSFWKDIHPSLLLNLQQYFNGFCARVRAQIMQIFAAACAVACLTTDALLQLETPDRTTSGGSRKTGGEEGSYIQGECFHTEAIMVGPVVRKGCFKCGDLTHIADKCPSATRLCYNCKSPDHESSECPAPRSADSKQCYGCGGIGHLAADCPTLRATRSYNAGPQKCYACGEMGHIARNCPTAAPTLDGELNSTPPTNGVPRAPAAGRGGRGGFRGGFRGGARGGFRGGFVGGARVIKCYNCGQLNHIAKDCTAPPSVAPQQRGPKTCYKCQQEGHIARDCPQNEQAAPVEASA
ncbi:auxilin-like clathrin-binding protein required for normal clathrin function [Microbotryomycetes sp. JL201]|nr:auxilin-like clathrin-binding protein required for normal clathrin function [Microbotryomycetes sp. JL201]